MAELRKSESEFLEDLARAKDSWRKAAMEALASENAALEWAENPEAWAALASCLRSAGAVPEFEAAISELLSGLVHSFLVTLDGGTQLAEETLLTISDDDGQKFRRYLHEYWPEYDSNAT